MPEIDPNHPAYFQPAMIPQMIPQQYLYPYPFVPQPALAPKALPLREKKILNIMNPSTNETVNLSSKFACVLTIC